MPQGQQINLKSYAMKNIQKTREMSGKIEVIHSSVCEITGRREIIYIKECDNPGEIEINHLLIYDDPGFISMKDLPIDIITKNNMK